MEEDGGGGEGDGGGGEGGTGGGGGEGVLHGLSHAAHIVHSIWYFDPTQVWFSALVSVISMAIKIHKSESESFARCMLTIS